jgi:MoxR-like ATPase
MFKSISEVKQGLLQQQYIASDEIATVVFLAEQMGKPILAEGPAGVGKTELAKAWAAATNRELIRLQCYEGLDESKALYEWEYSKQMLYTQLLRDKLNQVMGAASSLAEAADALAKEENVFFSKRFFSSAPSPTAARVDERATRRAVDRRDRPRRRRV